MVQLVPHHIMLVCQFVFFVSVQVLPTTVEFRCSNVLSVVASVTSSIVTEAYAPSQPAPILAAFSLPFVAVTLVTPEVIVMSQQLLLEPVPMPAP